MTLVGPESPGSTVAIEELTARIEDNHKASIEYLKLISDGQQATLDARPSMSSSDRSRRTGGRVWNACGPDASDAGTFGQHGGQGERRQEG